MPGIGVLLLSLTDGVVVMTDGHQRTTHTGLSL
jgi:hypothetical protein